MKQGPSICAYPFMQLSTVPAGFVRPCCYYTGMLRDSKDRGYSVTGASLSEVWNSESLCSIRTSMLAGERLPFCRQCYAEEAAGETSLRQRSLRDWADHPTVHAAFLEAEQTGGELSTRPLYLELKPGNLCNLKCRMCNRFDSSAIAAEISVLAKKYPGLVTADGPRPFDPLALEAEFQIDQMPNWSKLPQFWNDVDALLPSLEQLSFAGGEPTLLPEIHKLLKFCVDSGHAKNLTIYLASNFTRIDEDFLELSRSFRMFEFIASIDGVGAVQEYIRSPSRWSAVQENFLRTKECVRPNQTKLLVNLTLQLYNVLTFTDVLEWIESIAKRPPEFFQHPYAINLLYSPRYLSIEILPLSVRPLAVERIKNYVRRSALIQKTPGLAERFELILHQLRQPLPTDYRRRIQEFWQFTQILDQHRTQSLKAVDSILYYAVNDEIERFGKGEAFVHS